MENNIIVEQPKKSKFLNYINIFRGLAILLIIMGHTMQFGEANSLLRTINTEIVCGGTALFIFISGFLFQHLSKKFEYKNYLSKKWTNVILPYLFTSIIGIAFCFLFPLAYKNTFDGVNWLVQIPMHLSIGRVHNVPTWFIPMIVIFFFLSWILLKLENKGILYKLLPLFFLVTIFFPRGVAEYENLVQLPFLAKYWAYVYYILSGFVHFISLYVFGMFCSANKEIIDKFYDKRFLLWVLMLSTSVLDVFLTLKYQYCNFTISKTFLTMLLLCYLKHYDEFISSHEKLNNSLDVIAKYSFGLFFVHWYWFFIFNQIFDLKNVVLMSDNLIAFIIVFVRFIAVTLLSLLSLYLGKKIILFFNKDANTRMFFGV